MHLQRKIEKKYDKFKAGFIRVILFQRLKCVSCYFISLQNMKNLLLPILLLWSSIAIAQNVSIIPAPVNYQVARESFVLSSKTAIVLSDAGESNTANFLNDYLKSFMALHYL
jgi:hypothetical protein